MNALDRFKEFFKQEGVEVDEWVPSSPKGDTILTVAQAHFFFKDGEYIGVESDDMGYYTPKRIQ